MTLLTNFVTRLSLVWPIKFSLSYHWNQSLELRDITHVQCAYTHLFIRIRPSLLPSFRPPYSSMYLVWATSRIVICRFFWNSSGVLTRLSRRLIGELILYPFTGVRPSIRCRPSIRRPQCSSIFFPETIWPFKANFGVVPPWVGGTNGYSRYLGHITKMAATPIYGKNTSTISFPEQENQFPQNFICSI